jgi:hypothetical protein
MIQRDLLKEEFTNTLKPLFRLILQFLYDSGSLEGRCSVLIDDICIAFCVDIQN